MTGSQEKGPEERMSRKKKKDKLWESRGKKLTKAMAIKMLQGSKVKVKGLKKKSGDGTYDAYISMVDTGKWVNYEMTFEK